MRKERYWELDAARGTAILLMIGYHVLFQLSFFGTDLVPWFNPYVLTGAPIAALFITIAGISLVLQTGKEKNTLATSRKLFVRGIYILCFALLITVVSWLLFPEQVIVFGILHLIGTATILSIPFAVLRMKPFIPLGFGIICILISPLLAYIRGPAFLIPFGIRPVGFTTLDYEPLIPWFGVMLIGLAVGMYLYRDGIRSPLLEKLPPMPKTLSPLCFLGRHSLAVYLIHQPVIFAVLWLTGLAVL